MSIRSLIADDELLARKRIRRLLAEEPDISVIDECGTGREAIELIQATSPDLLFLDIQMPEVGGFDVLQAIPKERMPIIVFVTAYDQHALRAFEVHALDYLLKPFKQARFKEALDRARRELGKDGPREADSRLAALIEKLRSEKSLVTRFVVKEPGRVIFVKPEEVDWIESAANYALLHVGDRTHVVRETMRGLETKLCPKTFQRISRSVIVNLERIKELQPMGKGEYVVVLRDGKRLTMSRGIRELQQALEPT
jgi:two-component system, LytTR family, response regulator